MGLWQIEGHRGRYASNHPSAVAARKMKPNAIRGARLVRRAALVGVKVGKREAAEIACQCGTLATVDALASNRFAGWIVKVAASRGRDDVLDALRNGPKRFFHYGPRFGEWPGHPRFNGKHLD